MNLRFIDDAANGNTVVTQNVSFRSRRSYPISVLISIDSRQKPKLHAFGICGRFRKLTALWIWSNVSREGGPGG